MLPSAPPEPPAERRLLGIYGLAAELALPRDWLREQADAGRIPALRVGKRYLFNPAAVRRALAVIAATSSAAEGTVPS